jgi:hypothetical protein
MNTNQTKETATTKYYEQTSKVKREIAHFTIAACLLRLKRWYLSIGIYLLTGARMPS